jgi:hypothetical protein
MTAAVMPYRLFLLQKVQAVADGAAPTMRQSMQALLADAGLSALLTLRTTRRVERREHLEVWSAPIS